MGRNAIHDDSKDAHEHSNDGLLDDDLFLVKSKWCITCFIYYRKSILQITQFSQYRCTQLQYRFAVIFEAPSNDDCISMPGRSTIEIKTNKMTIPDSHDDYMTIALWYFSWSQRKWNDDFILARGKIKNDEQYENHDIMTILEQDREVNNMTSPLRLFRWRFILLYITMKSKKNNTMTLWS